MVEPEADNLESGRLNFERHGYSGRFIQTTVGLDAFQVDAYLRESGWERLEITHSPAMHRLPQQRRLPSAGLRRCRSPNHLLRRLYPRR